MKTEQLIDCEGITLESTIPFEFVCCDCGLKHHMVIVSEDRKPVGFAVKRVVDGEPRMAEKSQMNLILHLLRNPYGYSAEKLKWARLAAADLIELLVAPRPDAPTSQINHGSAPREGGHG